MKIFSEFYAMDFNVKVKLVFLILALCCIPVIFALEAKYDSLQKASFAPETFLSFASKDVLYEKDAVPTFTDEDKQWSRRAWRGEKVHTQLILRTKEALQEIELEWSDLETKDGSKIDNENIQASFLRYVKADGAEGRKARCNRKAGLDSLLVADVIDNAKTVDVEANTTQPVWLSIEVPKNTPEGLYTGHVAIKDNNERQTSLLEYTLEVVNRTLPAPEDWKFHLDLWQNPDAIARVHNVEKWSDEHMKVMKPYMQHLADAGQKVITTALIHDPWNSQTYDIYGSMIKWTKKKDNSWSYDYSVFDQYVSFMLSLGVDKFIECYSMIPWNLKFYYYDEALGKDTLIVAEPGSPAYKAHWEPMLTDFAEHLKEKGWFEKTTIAMDERPMEAMQKAIAIIRSADKDFKISLAGNFHPEIEDDLVDYCVSSSQVIDDKTMAERKRKGMTTTFYTCCAEEYPNTFTSSPPAEAVWLGWHAAYKGYDGYLRWAYNSWPKEPLKDSRFGSWPSGDTFLVYPGARSSMRFERLIEGIQDYEKIRILKTEFEKNNEQEKLKALENVLSRFQLKALNTVAASQMVNDAQEFLNSF